MGTIVTTLHKSYQEGVWTIVQAMREIISNALDGEIRFADRNAGQMHLHYNQRTSTITVQNASVTVPPKALLMGTSESRDDERTIGQFGEGLPMALLTLARDGFQVEIDNGEERWTPSIERSADFDGEPVLVIRTRKLRVSRDAFEVRVVGVSLDLWAQIQGLFLRLDEDFDARQALSTEENQPRVLLQPQYTGKVYNKGVFVMKRDDLMFGYDLRTELNRDRSLMDEYNLRKKLTELVAAVIERHSDAFLPTFTNMMLANDDCLELADGYSDIFYVEKVKDYVVQQFQQRYGDAAIAVEDEAEVKRAENIGRRGVRTKGLLTRIINDKLGSISNLESKRAKSIIRTWTDADLGTHERYNFETAKQFVAAEPGLEVVTFEVVTFTGGVKYVEEGKIVRLSRQVLMELEETIFCMVQGAAAATNRWGGESKILAAIIGRLFKPGGISRLMSLEALTVARDPKPEELA